MILKKKRKKKKKKKKVNNQTNKQKSCLDQTIVYVTYPRCQEHNLKQKQTKKWWNLYYNFGDYQNTLKYTLHMQRKLTRDDHY